MAQRTDVIRLDKNDLTYFTEEGYLVDHPIVTSVGVFEYHNEDGSPRYELRLPEEVFAEESLKSYEGKPVIITHDAGLVTKDNVEDEIIGTILSKGYEDGNNVRTKIIIHDTDDMKDCGLRELSLGYNLDLDETSGEYEGQHYDAIQRNIRINHLALVSNARAGEQARLNIDSKDKVDTTKGGKSMKRVTRKDEGVMSPDELTKAIEAFQTRKADRLAAKADEEKPTEDMIPAEAPSTTDAEENAVENAVPEVPVAEENKDEEPKSIEERVQMVKDRRDRRDAEEDPQDENALGKIAQMDEDIQTLLDAIDELQAQKDVTAQDCGNLDEEGEEEKPVGEEENTDEEDEPAEEKTLNADGIERILAKKLEVCRIGDRLNMDGLEGMTTMQAMKAVVKKVKPTLNLDGKSKAYVNAAYDMVATEVKNRKSTDAQKKQMTANRNDARSFGKSSASEARQRMIERREGGNE